MAHPDCGSLLVTIILSSPQLAARKMPPVIDAMRRWSKSRRRRFRDARRRHVRSRTTSSAPSAPSGIPFFRSPERALRALARSDGLGRNGADRCGAHADRPRSPIVFTPASRRNMPPSSILEAAGLPMPRRQLVADVEAAVACGAAPSASRWRSRFSRQCFRTSRTLAASSSALNDEQALRDGWQRLHDNVAASAPDADD